MTKTKISTPAAIETAARKPLSAILDSACPNARDRQGWELALSSSVCRLFSKGDKRGREQHDRS